ncbi:hypothetical protein B0H14DRAFT_2238030, partial [Mycena olivaceomarginata]
DSDADESPAPPAKQKPAGKAREPKSGAVAKSKAAGKEKDAKAWAVTAKELLMKKDFGGGWPALVGVWWKREEKVGFEGTKQGHPARKRPTEVKDWIARARKHTPVIASAEAFGKGWWVWWLDINPAWRGEERPMSRETGEWDCLDLYGPNGFLNVLIALKWWRDAMDEASPDWDEAIADVTWVLREM